jgi:pimeloyl-ACP methyl ester carboxylesterase
MHDDPDGMGHCCDLNTGCGYGYQCATDKDENPFCQLEDPHPEYLTTDTPRYQLCSVPQEMQQLYGFPIDTPEGTFQLAYYSNMQSITVPNNQHFAVETVLVMIHGSGGNADDYFCAALSVVPEIVDESVLVIAPLFASPEDGPLLDNLLVWADHGGPLSHSWRYGADAINAPVSSYGALDELVEYLAHANVQFPNVRQIAVAGHSAGGQIAHRWALLSNSPAWETVSIRAVVANPRSYCYLDNRRMSADGTFGLPDVDMAAICSSYDQWQWGLEPGGNVICPYKDQALNETPAEIMAKRYATRKVIYLAGEYDTIPQHDRCETQFFQGSNRNERAKNYFQALEHYFGRPVQQLQVVPGSPHDHSLMFQSETGRKAIFGQDKEAE